jgi:2-polyprenyl-6-hydroxyphenyl methylase/3-demethylubiquinone-9 3-methyltransferase
LVYSLEVIEHVFAPRLFAKSLFDLVEPGGMAIVSTPFHGYLKNLAIVAAGKFDTHFDPLWDGGHIKFWSEKKLRSLLEEAGFSSVSFLRVGRIRPLAKSTLAVARK